MTQNEFQQQCEYERQKLIIVELPNLIQRILGLAMLPLSTSKEVIERNIAEIKKITNAECNSALEKIKH